MTISYGTPFLFPNFCLLWRRIYNQHIILILNLKYGSCLFKKSFIGNKNPGIILKIGGIAIVYNFSSMLKVYTLQGMSVCEILRLFFLYQTVKASLKGRRRQALWRFSKAKIVSSGLLWCCSQRQESFEKTFFNPSWFRKMLYQNYLSRRLLLKSYLIFLWKKVSHGMAIKFVSGYIKIIHIYKNR